MDAGTQDVTRLDHPVGELAPGGAEQCVNARRCQARRRQVSVEAADAMTRRGEQRPVVQAGQPGATICRLRRQRFGLENAVGRAEIHDELPEAEHHDDDDDEHHAIPAGFKPHESPWTMTVPLVVLAFLSTVGGLVGIPYAISSIAGAGDINVFEHTLAPVVKKVGDHAPAEVKHFYAAEAPAGEEGAHSAHSPEEIRNERILAAGSFAIAVVAVLLAFGYFKRNPLKKMPKLFEKKWYVDEIYNKGIVDPITSFSKNTLWKGFDLGFIDGTVNGIGYFVAEMGSLARRIQVGFVRSYAAFILLGALVVIGYFVYFGFKLI